MSVFVATNTHPPVVFIDRIVSTIGCSDNACAEVGEFVTKDLLDISV
jgi:hypothetical protein